ncbi:UDP-N-acetylglucosamine 2-epimerase (non-hydrolyzing) [Halobacterium sp. R2-5]|uniref:non-hydrolyzing UDP-N-acetylglucosamine 2-epimerase n=1 Tax=Halobacterium sp. R2-5 TaxID=2715751 RepID=UPI00141DD819|nr:UDP-N-acetylglucosamine 2-epimerase (non-hydrolyzing) [Halobacterium sp. R2-5]
MNVWSVVGVRPEFVMATPVSRELAAAGHATTLVHTGQHHDDALSTVFFEELALPTPDHYLGIGSASRGEQVARAVERLTPILADAEPDAVLVYGDTTSTLAGAFAAVTTNTPLVHVEAGLRSGDWRMSEERTRVLVDHLADLRFAPTRDAADTLAEEGVTRGVHRAGDVRGDAVAMARDLAPTDVPDVPEEYVLATVHRARTTDDEPTLRGVLAGLADARPPVVLPIHPRTADRLRAFGRYDWAAERVTLVEPTGYAAFLALLEDAAAVATDSGGIQREAAYLGTPCVTLRETTEWAGTVRSGDNVLAGTDPEAVTAAVDAAAAERARDADPPTGAAVDIVATLERWVSDAPSADAHAAGGVR